jgi:hypothetical protein
MLGVEPKPKRGLISGSFFSYLRVPLSLLPAGARGGRSAPSLFCPWQMTSTTVRGNSASYNLLADGQGALGQSTQARLQEGGPPDRRRHCQSLSRPGRRAATQWRRGGRGWEPGRRGRRRLGGGTVVPAAARRARGAAQCFVHPDPARTHRWSEVAAAGALRLLRLQ